MTTVAESNIAALGTPGEIAKAAVNMAPVIWLYADRPNEVVAGWICDSYFSSMEIYGEWVSAAGTNARRAIELAVRSLVVAARLQRQSVRREWEAGIAGSETAIHPARATVLEAVLRRLGIAELPRAEIRCSKCGAIRESVSELPVSARHIDAAMELIERARNAASTLVVNGSVVLRSYRCDTHGIDARHELRLVIEHPANGWVGRVAIDLAGCLAQVDAQDFDFQR
jgi:hypothetical protein